MWMAGHTRTPVALKDVPASVAKASPRYTRPLEGMVNGFAKYTHESFDE